MAAPLTTNLEHLLTQYRYFLIDQFGVLHNGKAPYTGAIDALKDIHAAGAQTIIISNSGKRSATNEQRMAALGFPRESYHAMITSGETAWYRLQAMIEAGELARDTHCYLFSNDGDVSAIQGLGLQITDNISNAKLIMLSGLHGDTHSLEHYIDLLKPAIANDTLCICTNPDKWALMGNNRVFGPGRVAEEYEKQGGRVMWIGKPFPEIYHYCLTVFSEYTNAQRADVCCIGDSIEHDICGGHNIGLNTTLVRTGIHQHLTDTELGPLFIKYGAKPDHLIQRFSI